MNSNDIHHLAAAYALDALDDEERALMEAHYPSCEVCSQDIFSYRETAAQLAAAADAGPPASLKNRVLDEVHTTRQVSPLETPNTPTPLRPATETANPTSGWIVRVLAIAAAIVAVVAISIGGLALRSADDTTPLAAVLAAEDSELITLDNGPGVLKIAWSDERNELAIIGEEIPGLNQDRTYELWVVTEAGPEPSVLFSPDADGLIELTGELLQDPIAFAVTDEPAGGSTAPTTDIIWIGEI